LPSPRTGRSQSLAIKRKPLSSTASPIATRYSTRDYLDAVKRFPRPEQRFSRSCSLDSPTLYEFPDRQTLLATGLLSSRGSTVASGPSQPYTVLAVTVPAPEAEPHPPLRNISASSLAEAQTTNQGSHDEDLSAETASLTTQESNYDDVLESFPSILPDTAGDRTTVINTMSAASRKSPPPHLTLGTVDPNTNIVQATTVASKTENSNLNKPLPKSPASAKISAFFGWANSPTSASVTDFSDRGYSPLPSPYSVKPATTLTESDGHAASRKGSTYSNATEENGHYFDNYLQTPTASATASLAHLEEMEDELKAISAELASSIRREIDLEDLVDRLQTQVNNPLTPGKRTSDYYSDSGYSSAKFSDYDQAKEEISQVQRRAEQEKAQLRLDLIGKLQEERTQRRLLDQQIEELSQKASQIDTAKLSSVDAGGRVKELENTCDDLRRKLSEERQVKDNFEDLLSALKGELQSASNERDNLRDEIVPQLRARVEGLEAAAAENAKMAYETTKIQQELQSLRSENSELKQSGARMSVALSRSASVTGSTQKRSRPQSLTRSTTVKQNEPREALAERLSDVEAQRDALHSALKSLLERQEFQNRENQKRIRQLEMERDRLLTASPKKAGYEREVSNLREEITALRRRAEEAVEQKWQVEKGLSGLKMDLDRAEEEIASLRSLLKENDILIPDMLVRSSSSSSGSLLRPSVPVTSASLEKAYKDLQIAYADALERIKKLEASSGLDEKTKLAMERLEQSLAAAISDRDLARSELQSYQTQVESLQASEKKHFEVERDLADQLRESARRVEELAQQVRSQLTTNATLRTRLSDTVARGEADQRVSTERIASLQNRLRTLEEQVIAAQSGAEERVARHEEELSALKDAHNIQLQRLRDEASSLRAPGSPRLFPPKSPLSPMLSARNHPSGRSSRVSSPLLSPNRPPIRRSSTSPLDGSASSLTEQVETLKGRVAELEGALASADAEMQEVVSRMNTAQIEVMTLQEEREMAVRETRRLQRTLEEERVQVFEQRFKTMTT
ncbi:hypothetical protein B0T14DRAFT_387313, partial [Immersiella caudata]